MRYLSTTHIVPYAISVPHILYHALSQYRTHRSLIRYLSTAHAAAYAIAVPLLAFATTRRDHSTAPYAIIVPHHMLLQYRTICYYSTSPYAITVPHLELRPLDRSHVLPFPPPSSLVICKQHIGIVSNGHCVGS
eukprot:3323889-Rhodomonas_salina.1